MRHCPTCGAIYDNEVDTCATDGAELKPPEDDFLGLIVGTYKMVQMIGSGSMGSVYMGEHPGIGSRVAVKFLNKSLSNDKIAVARFTNEARAANLIGHHNIVRVDDLGVTADGHRYLIMELLKGEPLDARLAKRKKLPLAEAGPLALQCTSALYAAHHHGIIHRDLKPANIFITKGPGGRDFIKLLDFGVAKLSAAQGSAIETRQGAMLGTPWYMSPEVAMGEPAEKRSDIYSMGIILYEMATGRVPFPEEDLTASLLAHVQQPPEPPRSIAPEVPADYEKVILHALQKNRSHRQQSMAELHDDIARCMKVKISPLATMSSRRTLIEPLMAAAALGTIIEPAALELTVRERRNRRLALAAGAVALVALAGGAVALFMRPSAAPLSLPPPPARTEEVDVKAAPTTAKLTVRSDPPGASVRASWGAGKGAGKTPFVLQVPRGSKVHQIGRAHV